jgi:Methylamine utilisation protein MauE
LSWLLLALQVILSAVLLVAATEKLLRSEEFFAALRLSHLPGGSIAPIGVAVPALELTLALALLLVPARWLPLVFLAAALVLGVFTAWMGWVRARRLRVRCGCFGPGGGYVGPRTIGRNIVLLVLSLVGLALAGQTRSPLPEPSLAMAVTVTSLGACLALLLALRTAWPHLVLSFEAYQARQAVASGGEVQ